MPSYDEHGRQRRRDPKDLKAERLRYEIGGLYINIHRLEREARQSGLTTTQRQIIQRSIRRMERDLKLAQKELGSLI